MNNSSKQGRLTLWVTFDMHKVLELPRGSRSSLVLSPLSLLILDSTLILASSLEIPFPNTLSDMLPEFSGFPLAHFFKGANADLLLRSSDIREGHVLVRFGVRSRVPLAFICIDGASIRSSKSSLVGMCLSGEIALALILDSCEVSGAARDIRGISQLDVRAAVPDPVDSELRQGYKVFLGGPRWKL